MASGVDVQIEVVTPARTVLSERADSVIVPGIDGYLGIQANHAPLVAGLRAGVMFFGPVGTGKRRLAVSGGFVEVADNRVTVLADTAELADEIDVARARAAQERAERRMRDYQENVDYARAERALQRALTRLRAAGVPTNHGNQGN